MVLILRLLVLVAFLLAILGLGLRWRTTGRRPSPLDRSPAKGEPRRGVAYALTLGMLPWAKESTRLHALAYVRGIGFHVGVFAALGALAVSPVWPSLPGIVRMVLAGSAGLGAVLGLAGIATRLAERNLRLLSTADDHFAVALVTLFLALTAVALLDQRALAGLYVVAAVMLVYIPLGKIRHCLYFFYSRLFFGRFFGKRGVLPHPAR